MIFFDHIKGCSKDTTAYNKGLWTWIQFAKSNNDGFPDSPYPEIIVAKGSNGINKNNSNYLLNTSDFTNANQWTTNTTDTVKTLGNIITTYGPKQEIHKNITIDNAHTLNINQLNFTNGKVKFKPTDANDGLQIINNSGNSSLTYCILKANGITVQAKTDFYNDIVCHEHQITATSFNATSDKRAKTNIKRIDQEKALDIVNKLPVYSFNYKKDNIPSIGVLAQEAAIYDGAIPNFSLVNNEQATGENGDYQTVKESKLVYILWAAIQEQSRQINQLKSQLKELQK